MDHRVYVMASSVHVNSDCEYIRTMCPGTSSGAIGRTAEPTMRPAYGTAIRASQQRQKRELRSLPSDGFVDPSKV